MVIYSDLTIEFMLLDYSPSHSQLIIRSKKNKNRDYNIDILFKGVSNLLLPSSMKGIEISPSKSNKDTKFLIRDYGFKNTKDHRIFSLKNAEGKVYYINALCLGVYHNKLDILETSMGRYDMDNLGENILWYAD